MNGRGSVALSGKRGLVGEVSRALAIMIVAGGFWGARALPAFAGNVSIIAPQESSTTLLSRNRVLNVVVKVEDKGDINQMNFKDDKTGRNFDPSGRYEKANEYYIHYRLPLTKGTNTFTLTPGNQTLKVKFSPLSSLLNVDFTKEGIYKFHKDGVIPDVCGGCHSNELPAGAKVDRVLYGKFSPECYSCHSRIAVESEWKHFPASGLLCRTCHQAPQDEKSVQIPSGKVEGLCFQCHVNQSKWTTMAHIHGPVGTGDCSICHDPHGSQHQYQLAADGKAKLCVVCHVDKKQYLDSGQRRFNVHGILSAQGCVACHSPHATNYKFQLVSEINELCVSCHSALQGVELGHPVQKHPIAGRKDPRRDGYAFTCTSCHNPHGSPYRYLLIADIRGGRICVMCHDSKKNALGM
ncbi:MAG: hypothetical protein KJ950_04240 [Proteobacteria bacterium]|nr:hypothetical protein [Pseudomonadota bacterium]MBU1688475.1 hypothetical protein [Pseudomonadota bacterium]